MRVANGLRLVLSSSTALIAKEGANGAASLTQHGVDLAKNAQTAVAAVGMNLPNRIPLRRKDEFAKEENGLERAVVHVHDRLEKEDESLSKDVRTDASPSGGDADTIVNEIISEHDSSAVKSTSTNTEHFDRAEAVESMNHQRMVQDANATDQDNHPHHHHLKEGKAVPSTRVGRAMGFASLGAGLAAGTVFEAASRIVSTISSSSTTSESQSESIVANDANATRIAKTLCRMRGAALKLGQMLSIQDETILPPSMSKALEQVRQGADAMPSSQLHSQLEQELGNDWRGKYHSFDDLPFAAASIGQVHRASILDGDGRKQDVVVKVQYPGVANSIESDLRNLTMLVQLSGFAPPGLFIERVIEVGREELKVECDYIRESKNQQRLQELVHGDAELSKAKFRVPSVMLNHSSKGVITTEYCPGGTIDKVAHLDQRERNRIGRNIMRLTVKELFTWRFMQTDPNVSATISYFLFVCINIE